MNNSIFLGTHKWVVGIFAFLLIASCSKDKVVNELPDQKITAAFTITEEIHLVDVPIQFQNSSTGDDGTASYLWNFGDGETSTVKNPVHEYSEVGDYVVTLTAKQGTNESKVSLEVSVSLPDEIPGRKSLEDKLDELGNNIMVCAHRANHEVAPENSLASINEAIEAELGMIEIDIRQAKDGELVLMHDATIDRTTNGSGTIDDYLLQELQQFNLYNDNGTLTNERIPTLREVLLMARGKIYIDLDIDKKAVFAKVYDLVKQYGMLKQVVFYSSEFSVVKDALGVDNSIMVMPIFRSEEDYTMYSNAGLDLKLVQYNLAQADLAQQIKIKNWFMFRNAYVNTGTTPESDGNRQIDQLIDFGGSLVQTDHPTSIKQYLQSKNLN